MYNNKWVCFPSELPDDDIARASKEAVDYSQNDCNGSLQTLRFMSCNLMVSEQKLWPGNEENAKAGYCRGENAKLCNRLFQEHRSLQKVESCLSRDSSYDTMTEFKKGNKPGRK